MSLPPLVWVAVACAAGIAVATHRPLAPTLSLGVLALCAGAWCAALATGRPRVAAGLLMLACAALGAAHATLATARQPAWPIEVDGAVVTATGLVHDPPEPARGGWRATLRVRSVGAARVERPAAGLVRLTGRGEPPNVLAGAEVVAAGRFRTGRPAGNPGERSERAALARRGLVGVISTDVHHGIVVVRPGRGSVRGTFAQIRRRMVEGVRRALPAPYDGLLLSLLLGIDTYLPSELYRQYLRAGLVHLMVVSGTQVAIVAGVFAGASRLARLPLRTAGLVTGLGVAAFALLVSWAPSIGRAVIMATVALAAAVLGRARDPATTLSAAAVVLLALNPATLFDIGFQLSFAATWGLLFVAPALVRRCAPLGPLLGTAIGATVGAQVAVAPLLLTHFQSLPVAGLAANLLALPLVAALVPLGLALLVLLFVWPSAATWGLSLLRTPLDGLVWIGERFGALTWATVSTPPVPPLAAAGLFAMMLGAVGLASGVWRPARAVRTTTAAAAVLAVSLWYTLATRPPQLLIVTMLDVGQGDAILIQSPSGLNALVDGGGEVGPGRGDWDVGRERVVPALRRAGVRRVDVIVVSHPHEDHVGGLPAVVENFQVGLVLDPGVSHPSPSYTRLLRLVEAGRIPYRQAREGTIVNLGAGVRLTVLHPPEVPPAMDGDPVHARGVVARLTYGLTAVLLTGDVEAPVEQYLGDRGAPLASQVLKVGHHGSRTSTTRAFVERVRPQVAIISVGAGNSFGHPHPLTLATLTDRGVPVYRTDRHGAIRVSSDGATVRWQTFRGAAGARFH